MVIDIPIESSGIQVVRKEVRMTPSGNICSFCKRRLSEEEQTIRRNAAGLCHECFHLRKMIRRMNWHKKRVGVSSDLATERRILSWFCGDRSPQKR